MYDFATKVAKNTNLLGNLTLITANLRDKLEQVKNSEKILLFIKYQALQLYL